MRTDFWRAAKLLLAQLLNLDINGQLVRKVDYMMAENQPSRYVRVSFGAPADG